MQRNQGKHMLMTVTLAVLLLVGAVIARGPASIASLGCSDAIDSCLEFTELLEDLSAYDPDDDHMWDGPGSIQTTPTPAAIDEATVTLAPDVLDHQQPADPLGVRRPHVQLKGDGNLDSTESCTLKDVCGTVTAILRKGRRRIDCRTPRFMRMSRRWVAAPRIVRRYILGFYRRIKFL